MRNNRVAILGATGHIGKNLMLYFSQEKKYELFLFSRDPDKIKSAINAYPFSSFSINTYDKFDELDYDVIINCIGISDPKEINNKGSSILRITEFYDNKILDYLEKKPSTLYINLSSGAVFGNEFANPVEDSTYSKLNINNPSSGCFYSIAKINSEAKHRSLTHLNIVDLRVFSFFSRFIDLNNKFFMSELVSSIKNKTELSTDEFDIVRDFVHPKDLYSFIEKCIQRFTINEAFDVYSKEPISKFKILDYMLEKYGVKYTIKQDVGFSSPTGIKERYYSLSRKATKIGYSPTYSSFDTIISETEVILSK